MSVQAEVINADVCKWARSYEGDPFHAILCDPPYHLTSERWKDGGATRKPSKSGAHARTSPATGFMGMAWDGGSVAFRPETWELLARHLLPGGLIFAFGGGRTYHRMVCAMEDAGLIVHDMSVFAHGQGMPKGVSIDAAIDKKAGAKREVIEVRKQGGAKFQLTADLIDNGGFNDPERESYEVTAPATEMAKVWAGWRYGQQSIKPAVEPIALVQKPYEGKSLDCIVRTGAGALNIEAARVGTTGGETHTRSERQGPVYGKYGTITENKVHGGRWPSNFMLLCESVPIFRLKGNLPPDVVSEIAEYFNGHPNLRSLQTRKGDFDQQAECGSEVLQQDLSVGVQKDQPVEDKRQSELPGMRDDFLCPSGMGARGETEVLSEDVQVSLSTAACGRTRPDVGQVPVVGDTRQNQSDAGCTEGGSVRGETSELEGWKLHKPRVQERHDLHPSRTSSDHSKADDSRAVYPGAPDNRRLLIGASTQEIGGCTSQEWGEGGQSLGEPGAQRVGSTLERASSNRETTGNDRVREQRPENGSRAIEVAFGDIPSFWVSHFEYAGYSARCEGDDHLPTCPVAELDRQSGIRAAGNHPANRNPHIGSYGGFTTGTKGERIALDAGGASRFFFQAKPDPDETEAGLDAPEGKRGNHHPTKKAVDLCKQLAQLLLPPDHYAPRRILVPFSGSGSEMIAAALVGWEVVIGIEQDPAYCEIARARLAHWLAGTGKQNTSTDRVKANTRKGVQAGLDLWE